MQFNSKSQAYLICRRTKKLHSKVVQSIAGVNMENNIGPLPLFSILMSKVRIDNIFKIIANTFLKEVQKYQLEILVCAQEKVEVAMTVQCLKMI